MPLRQLCNRQLARGGVLGTCLALTTALLVPSHGLADRPDSRQPANPSISLRPAAVAATHSVADAQLRAAPPAGQLPAAVLQLPPNAKTALAVDLSSNQLHVLQTSHGGLELTSSYYVSIGKAGPFKEVEGDEKTPVGVYFVIGQIPGAELPEIYGAGAFPLN